MKKLSIESAEQGFTIGSVVLVCLLIAAVFFSARFVSNMNNGNKEQAGNLQDAFNGEPQAITEDQKHDDSEDGPSAEEQNARVEDIRTVNVNMDSLSVQIVAKLPGTYTGTCYADIELPSGDNHKRYVEQLDKDHECTITIPNANLDAGKTWKFQVGFYSKDGSVKGTHPESTFSL